MVYIPLKINEPQLEKTTLIPKQKGYIPIGEAKPVKLVPQPITYPEFTQTYEDLETPAEKIKKYTSFLQYKENENFGIKALKWLGQQVISPFTGYAQDVMERFSLNKVIEGVQEGKYDPKILDEFDLLKKTAPQIVGDAAMAVIGFTPLKELNAVKGLPILSAQTLKISAKVGVQIGLGYGIAQTVAEKPKPTVTELATGGITGAIGGAVVMPAFTTLTRLVGAGVGKILGKEVPPLFSRTFGKSYEKDLIAQGLITPEQIPDPPKLGVIRKLLKPISPARTVLQADPTASYIGLELRKSLGQQRSVYQSLYDDTWKTVVNFWKNNEEAFSKVVGMQEQGIKLENAPIEVKPILQALRVLEQKTFDLSKQAGADVSKWRYTPENHFSHLWTGDQVVVDVNKETGVVNKIIAFASNRVEGIQKLLKTHLQDPDIYLELKPRYELYKGEVPTGLSQKQFFKLLNQISDLMGSNVDDVLDEISMQGIAKINPPKTKIGQWLFRKGELGDYTTDPTKIYPSLWYKLTKRIYVDPTVRSSALKLGKIKDTSIRTFTSDLINTVAGKYQEQVLPYSITGKLTGLQAQLKLGARVSPAVVNVFQRLYGIAITGEKNFVKAQANIFTKEGQRILQELGVSVNASIIEGTGLARIRKWFNPLYLFGKTEGGKYIGNRNNVALSSYYKGLEMPLKIINDNMTKLGLPLWKTQEELAQDFARTVVDVTQFRYDISDFAPVIRNNLGKILLQFKTYGLNMLNNTANVIQGKPLAGLELFYPKGLTKTQIIHQAVVHFGTMFTQGGLKALGFGMERVLPASVLTWMALKAPALLYGVTTFLGVDVSASATVELSNLTSLLPQSDAEKVWDAIKNKNPKYLLQIDPATYRIYRSLEALQNEGWMKDWDTGKNIIQLKPVEIIEYGFGINPLRVAQESQVHQYVYQTTQDDNILIANAKRDVVSALKAKDFDLAINILANLKRKGLTIKTTDIVDYFKEGEYPRLIRDFVDYRKEKRPELFQIIKDFYEVK